MTNITQWASEAAESATTYNYEWDYKAVEWPMLTADSVVLEVGSYKGRWALQIAQRYNPRLFCFEPQAWACETTRRVLDGYNAQVFNYGLGDRDDTLLMGKYGTDGCTFVDAEGQQGNGAIRDIAAVLPELGIATIDLCLVNIEGYEHILIPYMFDKGIFPHYLMVQVHGDGYGRLRKAIHQHYEPYWNYGRVLSAWKVKGDS